MIFDSYMYQNPEKVLMRKQAIKAANDRACGSCIHRRSIEFKGEVVDFCELKRRDYGRRCENYEAKQ